LLHSTADLRPEGVEGDYFDTRDRLAIVSEAARWIKVWVAKSPWSLSEPLFHTNQVIHLYSSEEKHVVYSFLLWHSAQFISHGNGNFGSQ
jgi:hypothetical protein